MTTVGDRVLNKSLPKIGEKSLFTKDLEEALVHGGVDFVVHSLKDLPTQLPAGMTIGAVLKREDARDALVLNGKFIGHKLQTLPPGSLIGTSSLRRSAQLARNYSHLKVCDIRGNLNTRLAKLDAPQSRFSGIILANAGLVRMGWTKRVDQVGFKCNSTDSCLFFFPLQIIEPSELLYAVGQGALAVECRVNDDFILGILSQLCDFKTQCRIVAERSFLKTLGGGCSAPVGINSNITENGNEYTLDVAGAVWSLNGQEEVTDEVSAHFELEPGACVKKDEDDENVSPIKRLKLNENGPHNKSPEVIDDSGSSSTNLDKNASEIVNIHERVFDVCPFSGQSKNSEKEATDDKSTGCKRQFNPVNLPIGQDFMGECPVLNTEQKISFENVASGGEEGLKCPIAGKTFAPSIITSAEIDKCPFLNKQKSEIVEMIDYEALAKTNPKPELKSLVANVPDVKLYCGFFCHEVSLKAAFDKCEELGVKLADKLISAGALEIMKVAQDEIHSKC